MDVENLNDNGVYEYDLMFKGVKQWSPAAYGSTLKRIFASSDRRPNQSIENIRQTSRPPTHPRKLRD